MSHAPVSINPDTCRGCKKCVSACPFGVIYMDGKLAMLKAEDCRGCLACLQSCPFQAITSVTSDDIDHEKLAAYQGVWVFAEQYQGKVREVAYELLATGRRLADERGCDLTAVVLGHHIGHTAPSLIAAGADKVLLADHPEMARYEANTYTDAIHQLIARHKPEVLLAGATAVGRAFFGKVAARAYTGLTADCTALGIDPETRLLHQTRPAFGGNIMATIMTPNHRPQMATVRPHVFKMNAPDASRVGQTLLEALDLAPATSRVVRSVAATSSINIAESDIVVAGGRGLKKAENLVLLQRLAERLGGVVGVSRACVDAGWISAAHQVGQTGKTVSPKIYLAFGISGAIQHLEGMRGAETIIAVNSDPNAPIFDVADLGIVGDLAVILPALLDALGARPAPIPGQS